MRLTDSHATVEGRYQLVQARDKLEKIEADLQSGHLVDAAKLSKGITTAYYSISNEHYLKAQEHSVGSTADVDSNEAAKHIIAASLYLQEAARSTEHALTKDLAESLKTLDAKGKQGLKTRASNEKLVAEHLKAIGDGLQRLGTELQQP